MSLTVSQLLKIPELAGIELIAGESGLERCVKSVNVMEAPDIAQWLHGGELLLSTGYQFRDHPDDFEELVMAIHGAGAVALGFKNRFLHEFPSKAKDLAEWLGFPILGLPLELSYSDIIRIVILKTDEVENIRFSESVLRSFSQVIAEGGDITKILQNLMHFLKCDVCFLDAISGHCFCVSDSGFTDVPLARDKKALLAKYPHERLSLANTTYGYFMFERYPVESLWRVVLEHAKTAMLLAMQKDIATKQVEARYRDEFIQDLVTSNIRYHEEILNRASRFGWDLSGSLRCIIFDIDNYKREFEHLLDENKARELEESRQRIYSVCKQEMKSIFKETPYSTMSDSIVFLLNINVLNKNSPNKGSGNAYNDSEFKVKLKRCSDLVRKKVLGWTGFTVTVGVGDEKKDFFGCGESYDEARRAIEMMRPLSGGDSLYFWDELGVFTVLSVVCKTEEARKFCSSRMHRLLQDHTQNKELIVTLHALAAQNWNFKSAARELDIHYNTIRYRYEKLCALLDLNLSDSTGRLEVAIALKLLSLNPQLCSE